MFHVLPTSAITAFVGIDPGANRSGSYKQISKRGDLNLRNKALFQIMCVLRLTPLYNPVYQFLNKKRAQGMSYYVYMAAGANKFLKIYYGRVKEYLSTLSE